MTDRIDEWIASDSTATYEEWLETQQATDEEQERIAIAQMQRASALTETRRDRMLAPLIWSSQ